MPDSGNLVRIPGASHAHMRVQPSARRLAIRRASGRLDDLGNVSVDLLMPMAGGLDERGEPYPDVPPQDRRWAVSYRRHGREETVLMPRYVTRTPAGRVLVMDGVEDADGRIETWYFDDAAEREISRDAAPHPGLRLADAPQP